MRTTIFLLLALFPGIQIQDRKLPPIQEPSRTAVERRDLLQRFTEPSPLEGHYKLRSVSRQGKILNKGYVGYLVIGRRHLSIHLQTPGVRGDLPMIQSGYRSYRVQGTRLQMTHLVGHRNKPNGDVFLETVGQTEMRQFTLTGAVLRVYSSTIDYMEFVRIE